MLCESIFHILVEEGVISNEKALDAINGVVELTRENDVGVSRQAEPIRVLSNIPVVPASLSEVK